MTKWERGIYYAGLVLAVAATVFPMLLIVQRGYGLHFPWLVVLCGEVFKFIPVASFAAILGMLFVSAVRIKMDIQGKERKGRPRVPIFVICGIVWFLVSLMLPQVSPFFTGESQVQRGVFDNWFDRLL